MRRVFRYNDNDSVMQLAKTLKQVAGKNPVFFCVGSDLSLHDSLGPKVGTRLKERSNGSLTVYGIEGYTINAKNVVTAYKSVRRLHPKSKIIVIDASVDDRKGTIRVKNDGIRPGSGCGKNLGKIGNLGIMCSTAVRGRIVVEELDFMNSSDRDSIFFQEPTARLKRLQQLVNNAADTIAEAILLAAA